MRFNSVNSLGKASVLVMFAMASKMAKLRFITFLGSLHIPGCIISKVTNNKRTAYYNTTLLKIITLRLVSHSK